MTGSPDMSPAVLFRPARREDLAQLQALVDALYKEDVDASSGQPVADIALTYDEFERHPAKGQIVVFAGIAEAEPGTVLGYAILVNFWSNEYGGDVNEIDEIYIAPAYRNRGLASAFFSHLEKNSPPSVKGWSLQVSRENPDAARLYKRVGFIPCANDYLIYLRAGLTG